MTDEEKRTFLQEMMFPPSSVFNSVVHARNIDGVDTGTLIRTFVSEYAMWHGIDDLEWQECFDGRGGKVA